MEARGLHRVEHPIQRAVLAVIEEVVLAVEVVIEVGGREPGGVGDVVHAGIGEAALAEEARRGPKDLVALAVAPPRPGRNPAK